MVFNLVQECFWSFVKQTTFKEWKFEMRTIWWSNFPRCVRILRVTQRLLCFLGSKFYPLASAMHSTLLFWGLKLQRRLSWVTKRIGTQSFDSKNGILALLSESWKKLRFQKNLQSRFCATGLALFNPQDVIRRLPSETPSNINMQYWKTSWPLEKEHRNRSIDVQEDKKVSISLATNAAAMNLLLLGLFHSSVCLNHICGI